MRTTGLPDGSRVRREFTLGSARGHSAGLLTRGLGSFQACESQPGNGWSRRTVDCGVRGQPVGQPELKPHPANRLPNDRSHATDRAARREESFRREDMPTFITAAPRWQFAAVRRSHHQIARRKRRSFSELVRGSIVACCSMCGAAIAEEGQPVPNYKELINSAVRSSFVDPSSVGLVEISLASVTAAIPIKSRRGQAV